MTAVAFRQKKCHCNGSSLAQTGCNPKKKQKNSEKIGRKINKPSQFAPAVEWAFGNLGLKDVPFGQEDE